MNQPANVEQKTLNDILVWIAQRGDNIQDAPDQIQRIQERTAPTFKKISGLDLEAMLTVGAPRTVSMLKKNAFIYLPPITKGNNIVPILCVDYDYAEVPEVTLRIALYLFDNKEDLKAIGYRFETSNKEGLHRYFHVQHIDGFGQVERLKLPKPESEWIPTEYPAFPIDAQNPIELVVCMLVCLYDLDILNELERESRFKTYIRSSIEKMKLNRCRTQL